MHASLPIHEMNKRLDVLVQTIRVSLLKGVYVSLKNFRRLAVSSQK